MSGSNYNYNQQSLSSLSSISGSGYYSVGGSSNQFGGSSTQYAGGSGYYSGGSNQYGSSSYFGGSLNISPHFNSKPIRPSFKTPEGHYKLIKESQPPKQPPRRFQPTQSKITFYYQPIGSNSSVNINIHNNIPLSSQSASSYTSHSSSSSISIIPKSNSTNSYSTSLTSEYSSSPTNNTSNNSKKPIIQTIDRELLYFGFLSMDTFTCFQFSNIDKAEYEEKGGPFGLPNNSPTCLKICKKRSLNSNRLQIVIGTDSGDIYSFDPIQEKPYQIFNRELNRSKCTCIEWLPNSSCQFIVGFANGILLIFDITRTDQTLPSAVSTTYNDMNSQSSLNYNTILLNGEEFYVKLQKNAKYNPVSEWKVSNKSVNSLCFSPDGKHLAVACQDGYLHIYNFETKTSIVSFKSYFGGFLCVDWSPDGRYLVSGSEDDYISIWSFEELQLIARGQGHQSWVSSVKFDPYVVSLVENQPNSFVSVVDTNKYRILSGGEDTRLLLWEFSKDNLKKPKPVKNVQQQQQQQQQQSSSSTISNNTTSPTSSSITTSQENSQDKDASDSNSNNSYNSSRSVSSNSSSSSGSTISRCSSGGDNVVPSKPRSEVPIILPIVSHRVGSEPVTDLIFTKDWIVTVSNSKFSIWARPDAVTATQKIDSMCSPNTPHSYTKQYMMNNF
ncbi:hypothetical protein DLAC_10617 [Tieghemostelium lacteum]|uniref:Anaphase-promoting complex subunit 4-like WD40 domain-containing protein n=1 Tax=Tieghemostelium lacteum TaxID=361077 RepID=A0A151Z4E9_TIELA|nr:hypothetical protein DLAC_10617 [Tieghemostelium lacteum]|eukprot:KYQ88818.1 hypothetical protein DLAC_10617 [Tieghemostelium lacteum]